MLIKRRNKNNLPPVLLIRGGSIALSIARSLGSQGIKVYAIDEPSSYVRYSRFSEWIPLEYNHPSRETWLEFLIGKGLKTLHGAVIMPCSDQVLELVATYRPILKDDYILFEANDEVLLSMLDKEKTYSRAKKVGIPTPEIWAVSTREDILKARDKVKYPCALKPRISHHFGEHFWQKLFVIHDSKELIQTFEKVNQYDLKMLITEIIPGKDDQYCSYYSYMDECGNPMFDFTKRKIRQYRVGFGMGTYHITDWNPEVAQMGLKFLRGVGLQGMGNVEFKRDPRDGQLKLIECNARCTLVTDILTISGLNLPLFIYNRLTRQPLPPVKDYKTDVRVLRFIADCLAFRDLHRRGELSWWQWFRSLLHRQHFLYFRWSDPLPSIVRIFPFLNHQIKKLFPGWGTQQKVDKKIESPETISMERYNN